MEALTLWAASIAVIVIGYLLGSLPFAVIVSRLFGLKDPRTFGSGNPGATNVLRTGNKGAAVLTLVGDAAKGAIAVWLAKYVGAGYGAGEWGVVLAGLAAFLGHLFPVFLRFKGGKGVATFFGVLAALNIWVFVIAGVVWLMIAAFFRYSSLASICAAAAAPMAYLMGKSFDPFFVAMVVISVLLIWRHQKNIKSLAAGKETRIGQKSSPASAPKAKARHP
jgi:glycerol-3-phosphate acyltransferase PlsY